MEKIVLVGFGGHAKSVADVIEQQNQYKIIGYTDLSEQSSRYKYLGTDDALQKLFDSGVESAVICIGYLGKGTLREKLYSKLKSIGFSLPIIIDSTAIISKTAVIEEGTFIGKGTIINCEVKIGKCCIMNTGSIIEHESTVGDFSHVSVGAVVCGQVHIGKSAFLGANSTIIQCVDIVDQEIVPAGHTKKRNICVFGSVIYQGATQYINDFIDSINNQISRDFDIILINDDIKDKAILEEIKNKIKRRKVTIVDFSNKSYTPAQLRVELIRQSKYLGYKLLIMGDCDDTFSDNRVSNTISTYNSNKDVAFFYNDLKLSNGKKVLNTLPDSIDDINLIMQCNFIGLSMSAINLTLLDVGFIDSLMDFNSFVFDWYLFSRLLLSNKTGIYIENTATFYRIYDGNFAGLNNCSVANIEKEIEVKKKHYLSLTKYDKRYQTLYNEINSLKIEKIKINKQNSSWWSNIILER